MLTRFAFIVVLCLSILSCEMLGQSARIAVLEPGTFHGEDVALKQPSTWLGLFCQRASCELHQTKVRATRVPDPLGEDAPDKPTGTSIQVLSRHQPLLLLHGLAAPLGPVVTTFSGERSLVAGSEQIFSWRGQPYALRIEGRPTTEEKLPKGSRLLFTKGSLTQELFSLPDGGNDPYVTVLWIGDIDGDGKPDLYINASNHYNVANKVLWLSSLAKPGQLVGPTPAFITMGC
jgi:hypothetical protein